MKSALLLALRASTGLLLVIWGSMKLMNPAAGPHLSERYYGGLLSDASIQTGLAVAEVGLGVLVILGALRFIVYPLQALALGCGAIAIWRHLADPLGLYLWTGEAEPTLLFFPSTTVFVASLIMLAFRREDRLSLDRLLHQG
ncbi:hypothetical protein [Parvularcula sp. LCG005]|uniref:hypothetical protein n=1 Tax=Parvularcula sp. LCG005 TaxID=3078805 RepID=UPI0029423657|nr:hypothetical protein [Parvularcula sp. LCG005]WOI53383.1 hypothetical protein RUI03_14655 [Parvularcula sp. LCG005]